MYSKFLKRILDIIFSLGGLLIVSPLLLLISMLIIADSRGPIFFLQERVGKKKRLFKIYKFRTMVNGADLIGPLSTSINDSRITPIGKFLRRFSLDELPQLLNVLKGDMSLIGYRPGTLKGYSESFLASNIFDTRPGITGLAQVTGRSSLTSGEKRELELKYASNITFIGDLRIIFLTFIKVVFARSAY
ncbi:sugar transferase [Pseudoalteromonas sp. H105]|uniref:sugar transferase n=1 Tax=Pseudoalteromonas sp. H105 TaxID=1348393 RepID=UPI00073226DE|nr:sugar transferase [Pseudoalteromonas sp. H105]KTF15205.1 sugar transferase [Pseudoalteromonas sp. H105]